MNIKENALSVYSKANTAFEENKPAILIFTGMAAIIGAGVCAAVSTYKHKDKIASIKDDVTSIKVTKGAIGQTIPEDDTVIFSAKDFYTHYMPKMIVKIAKKVMRVYGVSFIAAVTGIIAIASGYAKEHNRYLEASEFASTVLAAYGAYRKAIIEKYGQEVDDDIVGFKKEVTEVPVLDKDGNPKLNKDGTPKTSKEVAYILDAEQYEKLSPLAFIWGEYNLDGTINNCFSPEDDQYNQMIINNVEASGCLKIQKSSSGTFTYNDVRDAFDKPISPYPQIGWNRNDPRLDDDNPVCMRARKIKYRIPSFGDQVFDGYVIDPNCCGDISSCFDTDPTDYRHNQYKLAH